MTPSRWKQIEELYHAALECEPGERAAFLARADPELRHEVESLLAQESGAKPLDHPAWDQVASSGQKFLVNVPLESTLSAPITVVTNWTSGLKH